MTVCTILSYKIFIVCKHYVHQKKILFRNTSLRLLLPERLPIIDILLPCKTHWWSDVIFTTICVDDKYVYQNRYSKLNYLLIETFAPNFHSLMQVQWPQEVFLSSFATRTSFHFHFYNMKSYLIIIYEL